MASSDLDELQKLELKEAFDEFDKVLWFIFKENWMIDLELILYINSFPHAYDLISLL